MLTSNMTTEEVIREVEWHTRGVCFPMVEALLTHLQEKVEEHETELRELESEIDGLQEEVDQLKATLNENGIDY